MQCPKCASRKLSKNGIRGNHKQNYHCNECGRQFVENPSGHYRIGEETRRFVDRQLLEQLSLACIARAAKVSEIGKICPNLIVSKLCSIPITGKSIV